MKLSRALENNIAAKAGLTIDQIRKMPIEDLRTHFELRRGGPLKFVSEFPAIGRGNVLRDGLISSEELNAEIDRILEQ